MKLSSQKLKQGRRIVIVDDEPQVIETITRILSHYDDRLEIASTRDGLQAGILLTSLQPHLVIADHPRHQRVPGMRTRPGKPKHGGHQDPSGHGFRGADERGARSGLGC